MWDFLRLRGLRALINAVMPARNAVLLGSFLTDDTRDVTS